MAVGEMNDYILLLNISSHLQRLVCLARPISEAQIAWDRQSGQFWAKKHPDRRTRTKVKKYRVGRVPPRQTWLHQENVTPLFHAFRLFNQLSASFLHRNLKISYKKDKKSLKSVEKRSYIFLMTKRHPDKNPIFGIRPLPQLSGVLVVDIHGLVGCKPLGACSVTTFWWNNWSRVSQIREVRPLNLS